MLLTIFMVSATLWSYSGAAVADFLACDHEAVGANTAATGTTSASAATHDHDGGAPNCNHGCHAANHLQGQISESLSLFEPLATHMTFEDQAVAVASIVTVGLYRPPILSPQV